MKIDTVSMANFGPQYSNATTAGHSTPKQSPYNVVVNPEYRFDNVDAMRIMTAAWGREWTRGEQEHRKGVMMYGPTGSGKSSFVEQFFARLNVPLVRVTWNPKGEASELLTDRILVDGMLLDRDQAITIAARQGLPLLVNEIDLADPAELVSLNDIIEKGLIVLPSGETIQAPRGFMVFATANTAGVDDEDGVYHGTRSQNASTLRRFFKVELGYPSLQDEIEFLTAKAGPDAEPGLITSVASTVVKIRQAFEGTIDGVRLSKPISRPEAVDWLALLGTMGYLRDSGINVAEYTLGFAFSNGMPEAETTALRLIIEQCFTSA